MTWSYSRGRIGGSRGTRPRGFILIVVLVVIVLLSLAAYGFLDRMSTEYKATHLQGVRVQARLAAESGAASVAQRVAAQGSDRTLTVNLSDDLAGCCAVPVGLEVSPDFDASRSGNQLRPRFTIISPAGSSVSPDDPDDPTMPVRYGLLDESSKLNLRALAEWDVAQPGAGRRALLALPEMTPQLAERLLDFVDLDHEPRALGAEPEFLESSVHPTGVPTFSLDDLLQIEGVTRELLYGADRDRNFVVDEADRDTSDSDTSGSDTSVGGESEMPPGGWSELLTLISTESPLQPNGTPRIDLNGADLRQLHAALTAELDAEAAQFVIGWRQFGPGSDLPLKAAAPAARPKRDAPSIAMDFAKPGTFRLSSAYDLLQATVAIPGSKGSVAQVLNSPWAVDDPEREQKFLRLLHATSTSPTPRVGRVNLLLAPRIVLAGVPGLEPQQVETILADRGASPAVRADRQSLFWLLKSDRFTIPQIRRLAPYLTTRGDVYQAQVIGFVDPRGPVERYELQIDATVRPARQLSWKRLAREGRGFPPAVLDPTSVVPPL